jgi:hypothetical protein
LVDTTTVTIKQQNLVMDQHGHSATSLNTARRLGAGSGTQTAALVFGGFTTTAYVGNMNLIMVQVGLQLIL